MRTVARLALSLSCAVVVASAQPAASDEAMLRAIYTEALTHGAAYENLRTLVTQSPGRLSGSHALARAIDWAEQTLTTLKLDRVYRQDVMVPHWERGAKESVTLLSHPRAGGPEQAEPLAALALGGSAATPEGGLIAEVVAVRTVAELEKLGREKVAGRIVFFSAAMDQKPVIPSTAYFAMREVRSQGPTAAAKAGAAAVLIRSLTHALNDTPHTGGTGRAGSGPGLPVAALSPLAALRLSAALAADPKLHVHLAIHSRWLPDAPSHNVIGEIRGTEFPHEILLVGGHLDSWDIAPGANDDGAGVVASMEVLRIFRALGLKPRHTLRCVLFTNEENGTRGAIAYAASAKARGEKHLLAIESDAGSFQPRGFSFGSTQGDIRARAARWLPLFAPYGITEIRAGGAGTDVTPLLVQGAPVAEIINDSQRYFDYHHTREDTLDNVNPRELHLGAAALAALIWLVDTQGL